MDKMNIREQVGIYMDKPYHRLVRQLSQKDGGGYVAWVDEFGECIDAVGETKEEALCNLEDVMRSMVSAWVKNGDDIPEPKQSTREHLDALCDVKVWWRKGGVKFAMNGEYPSGHGKRNRLSFSSGDDKKGKSLRDLFQNWDDMEAYTDNAFKGRNMHKEYPGHVLYVKFHGEETTMYLLDSNGALVKRGVLLRNPGDEPNAYALWAAIAREMVPKTSVFVSRVPLHGRFNLERYLAYLEYSLSHGVNDWDGWVARNQYVDFCKEKNAQLTWRYDW